MNYTRETMQGFLKKTLAFTKTFKGNGEDFSAFNEASDWLNQHGYNIGSMERSNPIGVAKNSNISKWTRLGSDRENLDGVLISYDFMETSVTLYLEAFTGEQ